MTAIYCWGRLWKSVEIFIKMSEVTFFQGWQRHNWPALMGFALYGQSDILNSLLALFFHIFKNQSGWFSLDCEFRHRKIKEFAFYWDSLKRRSPPGSTVPDAPGPPTKLQHPSQEAALSEMSHTAKKSQQLDITSGTCPNHTRQLPVL